MRALMITGGSVSPTFASAFMLQYGPFEMIVAVDGGLEPCSMAGLIPTHILGDFDTADEKLLQQYAAMTKVQVIRYPAEKDATDTELALDFCMEQGAEEIAVVGGTGSRIDHSLANIFLLLRTLKAGISCAIYDEHNRVSMIESRTVISKAGQYGTFVSLIPVTASVTNVSLRGFRYNLEGVDFQRGSSLGVSNEIVAEQGEILFSSGIFLLAETRD